MNISTFGSVFEQGIRLLQMVGVPVMAGLFIIGLMFLLTAGKNPFRKRIGYLMSIGFGIGVLAIAYLPAIIYTINGEASGKASEHESLEAVVSSSSFIGESFFTAIQYVMLPLAFSTFYMGVIIRLVAAKNPQRRRIGIGLMLFSPLVLGISHVIPITLTHL
ncbi:hypothetical protein AM501_05310 [Aneurinibacillus migulanus]|uniref:hypothetical protein n=1 Tax=Aneurinibacillus migulanus TaxID=47500 RepID=UPI0005BA77D9|nr:hypothetical protein [Aneurinibacillus migulanus]KIV58573.1 hypothetical protein TS64_04305 [Aneurinibacillus migulanus]KPD09255.1 hypothetical protein AM501_05310 [Aneurinibacillus migulanus]